MPRKAVKLNVRFSYNANRSMLQIWRWNFDTYDEEHANDYISFLMKRTSALDVNYLDARIVPTNPSFRYKTFRKSTGGHGHVVIYKVNPTDIYIVDFFHTAQDWQAKVAEME